MSNARRRSAVPINFIYSTRSTTLLFFTSLHLIPLQVDRGKRDGPALAKEILLANRHVDMIGLCKANKNLLFPKPDSDLYRVNIVRLSGSP
jgi:hypothetical protein